MLRISLILSSSAGSDPSSGVWDCIERDMLSSGLGDERLRNRHPNEYLMQYMHQNKKQEIKGLTTILRERLNVAQGPSKSPSYYRMTGEDAVAKEEG